MMMERTLLGVDPLTKRRFPVAKTVSLPFRGLATCVTFRSFKTLEFVAPRLPTAGRRYGRLSICAALTQNA